MGDSNRPGRRPTCSSTARTSTPRWAPASWGAGRPPRSARAGIGPWPSSGTPDVKVVDTGLQRTMEAIADRAGDVVLGSHDGDFLPQVQELMAAGRRVGLLAFREFVNTGYLDLVEQGLEIFDLEDEAKAFNHPLPRLRIIDLADFDPTTLL